MGQTLKGTMAEMIPVNLKEDDAGRAKTLLVMTETKQIQEADKDQEDI